MGLHIQTLVLRLKHRQFRRRGAFPHRSRHRIGANGQWQSADRSTDKPYGRLRQHRRPERHGAFVDPELHNRRPGATRSGIRAHDSRQRYQCRKGDLRPDTITAQAAISSTWHWVISFARHRMRLSHRAGRHCADTPKTRASTRFRLAKSSQRLHRHAGGAYAPMARLKP